MKYHFGRVDEEGNYRNRSRKDDGYLIQDNPKLPFPALVVAYYPKSQSIDVLVPTRYGMQKLSDVAVYGNFFEATGTIQGPKIATTEKTDGYQTFRSPVQKAATSSSYVLENHIEALVQPTTVGFAASEFRFLTPDSPMLNNAKIGRKITRHDDGSFYVHDEDGNMQFKHPSGLNIRIGRSEDDIELETAFEEHAKNALDFSTGITFFIEFPDGGKIGYTGTGLLQLNNAAGALKTDILDAMLDHDTNTLDLMDQFLDEYSTHSHPCIVPTGVPTTASNAVALRSDVQLEMTGVSTTKSTVATIFE